MSLACTGPEIKWAWSFHMLLYDNLNQLYKSPKSIFNVTLFTKNCIEYNITVITKLHSKFEFDPNKFMLSLVGRNLRNKGQSNISAPEWDRNFLFHSDIELTWLHYNYMSVSG